MAKFCWGVYMDGSPSAGGVAMTPSPPGVGLLPEAENIHLAPRSKSTTANKSAHPATILFPRLHLFFFCPEAEFAASRFI